MTIGHHRPGVAERDAGTSMPGSRYSLKTIRFAGELLPQWAQLLDLAARLSQVPEDTRHWFSIFANRSGVDDARTVARHCEVLRSGLEAHRADILEALGKGSGDSDAATVVAAWLYALETMIQKTSGAETCTWQVEGTEDAPPGEYGDGDVTLRRI